MRSAITILLIALSGLCFAGDRPEKALLEMLSHTESLLNGDDTYHIRYDMGVTGGENGSKHRSMPVNYYKSGARTRVKMGDMKEMMYKNSMFLQVNHVRQQVVLKRDTGNSVGKARQGTRIVGQLSDWAKSGSVSENSCSNSHCFTIRLDNHPKYATVQLWFEEGDAPLLKKIKTRFLPVVERYQSMTIDYQSWNMEWQPSEAFPRFQKYVVSDGRRFKLTDRWSQYKFYQPRKLPEQ